MKRSLFCLNGHPDAKVHACGSSPRLAVRLFALTLLVGPSMGLLAGCNTLRAASGDSASARAGNVRSTPGMGSQMARPGPCQDDLSPADNVALSGIAQSIRDDKAHAALAQLDALKLQAPRAQILRADALRRVNRSDDARKLYDTLLGSCLSGQAHHGLGLLLAGIKENTLSLEHLQMARELMPTEAQVRNDLGYALLLRRDLSGARFEFMTAIELAPDFPKPRHNLYMLANLQNEDGMKKSLARQWGFDASTEALLQESARQLPRIAAPEPAKAGAPSP
jgi:tetratricopeptide (TPR) repeat protein